MPQQQLGWARRNFGWHENPVRRELTKTAALLAVLAIVAWVITATILAFISPGAWIPGVAVSVVLTILAIAAEAKVPSEPYYTDGREPGSAA